MLNCITTRSISFAPKLRARLIKFRYGAARDQPSSAAQQHTSTEAGKSVPSRPGEAIYDFEVPAKWKRKPLSEEEIAVINNGGPL